jgi:hypothetical protein
MVDYEFNILYLLYIYTKYKVRENVSWIFKRKNKTNKNIIQDAHSYLINMRILKYTYTNIYICFIAVKIDLFSCV